MGGSRGQRGGAAKVTRACRACVAARAGGTCGALLFTAEDTLGSCVARDHLGSTHQVADLVSHLRPDGHKVSTAHPPCVGLMPVCSGGGRGAPEPVWCVLTLVCARADVQREERVPAAGACACSVPCCAWGFLCLP